MGDLDIKALAAACNQKFSGEDAEIKIAEYCSKWDVYLKDPAWHPFKMIVVDGKHQVWIWCFALKNVRLFIFVALGRSFMSL